MRKIIRINKNVDSSNKINFLIEQLFLQKNPIILILIKTIKSNFSTEWTIIQVRFSHDQM